MNTNIPNLAFLDIDGVLNHNQFYKERQQHILHDKSKLNSSTLEATLPDNEHREHWAYKVDQVSLEQVKMFDEFCTETNTDVVISSTWRSDGLLAMRYFFNTILGCKFKIVGVTPHSHDRIRGFEIKTFLEEYLKQFINISEIHKFNRYVIIDDDSDMLYNQRHNFFHIDGAHGITPNNIYKMTNFLKSFTL